MRGEEERGVGRNKRSEHKLRWLQLFAFTPPPSPSSFLTYMYYARARGTEGKRRRVSWKISLISSSFFSKYSLTTRWGRRVSWEGNFHLQEGREGGGVWWKQEGGRGRGGGGQLLLTEVGQRGVPGGLAEVFQRKKEKSAKCKMEERKKERRSKVSKHII